MSQTPHDRNPVRDKPSDEAVADAREALHRPPRYLVVPPEMEARLTPLDERPLKPCKEEAPSLAGEEGMASLAPVHTDGTGLE